MPRPSMLVAWLLARFLWKRIRPKGCDSNGREEKAVLERTIFWHGRPSGSNLYKPPHDPRIETIIQLVKIEKIFAQVGL